MSGYAFLAIYIGGAAVTWFFLARIWMRDFGGTYATRYEHMSAAGWALLGAFLWPILAVVAGLGQIAKRLA